MPDPDTEPEKYSIDDMMDRLRSRGEGAHDGEAKLVVRDDGTEVFKMRKRKRRSHQPKKVKEKRQQRFRVAQLVAAVGLVAGAGLALVGSVIYFNSPAYQKEVLARIRTWTGAEPRLTQFRVSPVSAAAAVVELDWPESSILKNLKVSGVKSDLRVNSLFGGAWKGSEMLASHGGTLVVGQPTGASPPAGPPRSGECPFQFRYRSPRFNILMGGGERPAVRVSDSEVSLVLMDSAATTANLQLEGGTLHLAGWGDFGLKFASLQFEPGGVRVGNIRLSSAAGSPGEIEILNPSQVVLDPRGGEIELAVQVRRMPLATLLGPGFGTWLAAEVETPDEQQGGTITVNPGSGSPLSCQIPFRATASSDSRGGTLPLFGLIAREIKETWYQTPGFDLATSGTVVRDDSSAGLDDLRLESRGRLAVTGRLMVDAAGNLNGIWEVGLPDASLGGTSLPFRSLFKRHEGGYSWATVRISGTGRKPLDDLQKQLDAAATSVAPASGGVEALEDEFRKLTTPDGR